MITKFGKMHAKIYMLHEKFWKTEACLLHSDFVGCMDKFCRIFLPPSNFHAYKVLHVSCKNSKKNCGATYKNM